MSTRRGFIKSGAAFSTMMLTGTSFIGEANSAFWLLFAARIAARSAFRSGVRSASRSAVSKSLRRGASKRSNGRRARTVRQWSDTMIKVSANVSLINMEISPGVFYQVPESAPVWGVKSDQNLLDMDVNCEVVDQEFMPVKFRVVDLDSGEVEDEAKIALHLPGHPFNQVFSVPRPLREVAPGRKLIYGSVSSQFQSRVQIRPEPIVVVM